MATKTLTLVKGGHKYMFRYATGREDEIVSEIVRLAEDPGCNLDWLDAATLSFQVARATAGDCRATLKPAQRSKA